MDKLIIPCLYLKKGQAVKNFADFQALEDPDPVKLAGNFGNQGADEVLVFDLSEGDKDHEEALEVIKKICAAAEVPVIGAGNVKRMEDVKKLIYAGCRRAVLNFSKEGNRKILKEVSQKFGKEKITVYLPDLEAFENCRPEIQEFAGLLLCDEGMQDALKARTSLPVLVLADQGNPEELLCGQSAAALTGKVLEQGNYTQLKHALKQRGIPVNTFESSIPWEEFKLNSDGLIPCVVQDYKTDQVLMLAYMNREAYEATLSTGRMTYWSRSRQELWVKGLTSGHFQYVKSLSIDCDNDTLLAKVSQIGAACHTGSRSCFYRELARKEYDGANPLKVFENVFAVIQDRKIHPKEGSYTNYLFEKGIDKILKKVGEECTEIVIAAKNPDKEEIKYEISDFLYHVMVLMAEKGVTWEDITRELARR